MAITIKLFLFLLLLSEFSNLATSETISLGSSLSLPGSTENNSYWLSDSGRFAFGFHQESEGNFSVAIWFRNSKQGTVVWSADVTVLGSRATLVLNSDGKLVLHDDRGPETLISGNSQPAESARMLDSGKFALFSANSTVLWQSFDSPSDTLLPGQPLLAGQRLVSAGGRFQLSMQRDGNLVQYPLRQGLQLSQYHSYWNTGTYTLGDNVWLNLDGRGDLYLNRTGFKVNTIHSVGDQGRVGMYRLTLDSDGLFRLYFFSFADPDLDWIVEWASTSNTCDPVGLCGLNSYCSVSNQKARCQCIPSFEFVNQNDSTLGCKKNSSLVASDASNEISFEYLNGFQWEPNYYSNESSNTVDSCEELCRSDYNCEIAVFGNQFCKKQKLPLIFAKVATDGSTTVIKVQQRTEKRRVTKSRKMIILGAAVLSLGIVLLAVTVALVFRFRMWEYAKVKSERIEEEGEEFIEELTLRAYQYSELEKATNGFADRIGQGGFGTVFKGLIKRKVVAVKRLERLETDDRTFRNEMRAIGKTHHRNLVRLLGYCYQGAHRLLVYEYIEKGSLSDYLFQSETTPDWEERLEITLSIARGILYLHEECDAPIIHCDIKPENILMDDKNNPKIADFGLAKLLMPNQSRTVTGLRGTRGYVAPEWHRNVPITVKADVYSFGIVLLEIVCCRRSVDMDVPEDKVVLSNWVFECFVNNELDQLVEEVVDDIELEKMIKLGLWCIQEEASLRPSMRSVCLMLEGTVEIPRPPHPMSSG